MGPRRRLVAFGVVALALTSCSDDDQQSQPGSTLPSAAVSVSAPPTLPALGPSDFPVPAEARQRSVAGADAFLDYYVALINHEQEQAVPAGQPLRELSQKCMDCDRIADSMDRIAAASQRFSGGTLTIDTRAPMTVEGVSASTSFLMTQSPSDILDPDGAVVADQSLPELGRLSCGVEMTWSDSLSSWLVTTLTVG